MTSLVDLDAYVVLPQGAGVLERGSRARGIDVRSTRGLAANPWT